MDFKEKNSSLAHTQRLRVGPGNKELTSISADPSLLTTYFLVNSVKTGLHGC